MKPTHALLKNVIADDLGCLSKIFNDTKHRAASLRQLSFLSYLLCRCDIDYLFHVLSYALNL